MSELNDKDEMVHFPKEKMSALFDKLHSFYDPIRVTQLKKERDKQKRQFTKLSKGIGKGMKESSK